MADTWREVADALAARLVYQAHHCPHHGDWKANAKSCAFCDDTAAYERWVAKSHGEAGPRG